MSPYENIGGTDGLTLRSNLNARQRTALTGVARNDAEAAHVQSFLDTIEKVARHEGPDAVLPRLRLLEATLRNLNGVLTPTETLPQYANVGDTHKLTRSRTLDEAFSVAGANLRRAISGGDLPTAFRYLDVMREAVNLASNEGRA